MIGHLQCLMGIAPSIPRTTRNGTKWPPYWEPWCCFTGFEIEAIGKDLQPRFGKKWNDFVSFFWGSTAFLLRSPEVWWKFHHAWFEGPSTYLIHNRDLFLFFYFLRYIILWHEHRIQLLIRNTATLLWRWSEMLIWVCVYLTTAMGRLILQSHLASGDPNDWPYSRVCLKPSLSGVVLANITAVILAKKWWQSTWIMYFLCLQCLFLGTYIA